MKIKDFEQAIYTLGIGIRIDEIIISHNNVKKVYAHNRNYYFMWDGVGKAWSAVTNNRNMLYEEVLDVKDEVTDSEWIRNEIFDLYF